MYFSVVVAKLLSTEEPWFGFKYLKLLVGKKRCCACCTILLLVTHPTWPKVNMFHA